MGKKLRICRVFLLGMLLLVFCAFIVSADDGGTNYYDPDDSVWFHAQPITEDTLPSGVSLGMELKYKMTPKADIDIDILGVGEESFHLYVDSVGKLTDVAKETHGTISCYRLKAGKQYFMRFSQEGSELKIATVSIIRVIVPVDICSGDNHSYGNWNVIKNPTTTAAGERQRKCSKCGKVQTEITPKLDPPEPEPITDLFTVKISKLKTSKQTITVKWKKLDKKKRQKIQGFEIQVSTDKEFKNIVKQATAGKKKTSLKMKGFNKKTKYWVRLRAYRNDGAGKHVSPWKTKKIKVK